MKPIIEELGKKYTIEKVNVDKEGDKAGLYEVMSLPTFIVMKGQEEIGRITGITTKEKIEELMRQ